MYIDSHQHFWKLSRGDYSWMSSEYKPLYKDFFPSDLEPLIREKNISKTIIVQAADTVAETEFTLKLAEETEFVAGVVGWVDLENHQTQICSLQFSFEPFWLPPHQIAVVLFQQVKQHLPFQEFYQPFLLDGKHLRLPSFHLFQ